VKVATAMADCVQTMMRRRSARSASTPPKGPTSTAGKRSANATMPSQNGEPVSSQAYQPTAVRCIQVPTTEIALTDM
jgi:hypothetical protein